MRSLETKVSQLEFLINGRVMLSEALQRNAEHKARLSNISFYFYYQVVPN